MEVTNNVQESRYEYHQEDQLAGYLDYVIEGDVIDIIHTIVPDEFAGQGIASKMVKVALAQIEDEGLYGVRATCPFVRGYFRKHPEVQHLLAEGFEHEIEEDQA